MNSLQRFLLGMIGALALFAGTAAHAEEVFYYHTDAAGTPLAMSDSSGQRVWEADYKPFGEEYTVSGTSENDKRFVGKEKDDETGLNYFGARYLSAGTGRFLAPDPVRAVGPSQGKINDSILVEPQRLNTFAYSLNNPVRWVDPFGLHPLATTKGRSIKHFHRYEINLPDPTQAQNDSYTQIQLREGATKTGRGGYYENCHADAYRPSEDVWIDNPTVIIEDEYEKIPASKASSGDRVTYYDSNGNPIHSGVVSGNDRVESKHGAMPKYEGPTKATDRAYPGGITKEYYRKK